MLVYECVQERNGQAIGYLSIGSSNWSNIVLHCLDNSTIGKVSSNIRQWSQSQKCLTCSWFCCAISNQKNFVSRPTTSCSNMRTYYFRNTSFNGNWNIMDTFFKRNGLLMIIHIWALLCLRAPRERMRILSGIMNIDLWFSICTTYKLGGT